MRVINFWDQLPHFYAIFMAIEEVMMVLKQTHLGEEDVFAMLTSPFQYRFQFFLYLTVPTFVKELNEFFNKNFSDC